MKKLFAILAVVAIAFSCNNATKDEPVNYAIVSGKIANNTAKNMEISNRDRSVKIKIPIDSTGSFSDTLRIDTGNYYFYDGRNYNMIHIDKGDHINISYDAIDFSNTLTYTGEGSAISTFLMKKNKTIEELIGRNPQVYKLDEEAYKKKMAEVKSALLALVDASKDLPKDYAEFTKKDAEYFYLNELNKYEKYHAYYIQKPDFKASDAIKSELSSVDYTNDADYSKSPTYKELVDSHFSFMASDKAEKEGINPAIALMDIAAGIKSEKIKNGLLNTISYNMKYEDDVKAFYDKFMATCTDEKAKKELTETYNKLKELSPGSPSPKFENYENYAGGTTSLDDLKGKYVYIDVWATWCGPCLAEIPSLKKLEEKYRGKNIQFVSISIDQKKDYEKWKNMVKDKELKGIQLYADNDWNSKFVQDYLINGIPHFILIDPKGKIVKYSAPRPSNPKLEKLLEGLKI